MIEKDGAIMITGGSSSGVAVAVQALCQEAGVIFMAGLTHSNDTTGKDKKANGFRHFFNSYMSGAALAPVLANAYGTDRKAYHLTADYNWGYTTEEAIRRHRGDGLGNRQQRADPAGARPTSRPTSRRFCNSGADVLVLNHYGGNMVNSLTNAVQFGLRDAEGQRQEVRDRRAALLAPDGRGAGENIKGIFGSTNWHWSLPDAGTQAFVQVLRQKYGFPPSQAAHTCYVQALLYADAVERAGSFNPCAVVEALEGFEFDGWATARRFTAPKTTSASRTCWS
jgi:branched-chain amino acid transport system substrate-binding protein